MESKELPTLELVHAGTSQFNQRYLARLADGAQVECVLYRGDTLCLSTQVGCAVGCPFCASGSRGLLRPLTLRELIAQVDAIRARGAQLRRVTLSGIGEPLHNHANVRAFVDHCRGQRLAPSLTTSGGPLARLQEWLHAPHNGLTISVHAGSEAVRARLVPNGPALEPLFALLAGRLPHMTQHRKRKTALAYLVLDRVNDGADEVDAFIARVLPLGLPVHLYAYNPVPTSALQPAGLTRYRALYARMVRAGLRVRMSSQARLEANGGCGTLVAQHRRLTLVQPASECRNFDKHDFVDAVRGRMDTPV